MSVLEWRATRPIRWPLAAVRVRALWLSVGQGWATAGTGLLLALVGGVTMVASMPDGLRGSFIGAVFAAVGVLLLLLGASIQTEINQAREE